MPYKDYHLNVTKDLDIIAFCGGNPVKDIFHLSDNDKDYIEKTIEKLEDETENLEKELRQELVEAIGSKLGIALFPSKIKDYFYNMKEKAKEKNQGIRIRLNIEKEDISNYPWESISLNGQFLATWIDTPITRTVNDIIQKRTRKFDKPLKILFIGSSPTEVGLSAVDVENEIEAIENALKNEITNNEVEVKKLRIATDDNIINYLKSDNFNIVHYIGHGKFEDGIGTLALVKPDTNEEDLADYKRIGHIFQNGKSFRRTLLLLILNSCQGAKLGMNSTKTTSNAFTGLAPELIKIGFPSIIAMRHSITNPMAHSFTKEFYTNLFKMPIDENLQRVRQKILVDSDADPLDFTGPVLFMNSKDGTIIINNGRKKPSISSTYRNSYTDPNPEMKKRYYQYKEQFQSYLVSNEITITEVWEKIKSFIVNFDPDIYPINDLSKTRINTLSNSLQLSIRDLYEKRDIEDTSQLEKKIDEHYKAIYKHFKMIFEEPS